MLAAGSANAESKYPDHTVRIVVPFPPGGITDVAGRLLSDKLGQKFGQSFIVDNRPGAGSIIGSDIVAKATRSSWDRSPTPSSRCSTTRSPTT
jgi:tripartite-type tricarboxylate transporter receptor subunit TctC